MRKPVYRNISAGGKELNRRRWDRLDGGRPFPPVTGVCCCLDQAFAAFDQGFPGLCHIVQDRCQVAHLAHDLFHFLSFRASVPGAGHDADGDQHVDQIPVFEFLGWTVHGFQNLLSLAMYPGRRFFRSETKKVKKDFVD